jgi:uncharacterized protein (DUF1499 family)
MPTPQKVARALAGAMLTMALAMPAQAATDDCVRKLAACPDKPNCVATNDALPDRRYPPLKVKGDPSITWARIVETLLAQERTRKLAEESGYLHATFTSAVFEFVDDVELTFCNANQELWLRSASRKGYWDIGANSSRVEDLVEKWRSESLVE